MPVRVTDYISTSASSDTYATHKSTLGQGGHQEVATINDRNAITIERTNIGMKVYVVSDNTTYVLDNNMNWVVFGGKQNYTHDQQVPSTSWVIDHNLGFYPNIIIIDSTGEQVMGDVAFNTINRVTLTFSSAIFGIAQLS